MYKKLTESLDKESTEILSLLHKKSMEHFSADICDKSFKSMINYMGGSFKVKVVPLSIKGTKANVKKVIKKKPTVHNWISCDDTYEYTTDFALSRGWPVRYKQFPEYIAFMFDSSVTHDITNDDIPSIILNGYKPYRNEE